MRDRQHRQAGLRVVLDPVQRQRPEVRRRPQEDDQAHQPGLGADLAAHRGPAQHRWHRARGAADDDVLRRRRLQQHGVDDRVADEGGQRQPERQRVHAKKQQARCRPHRAGPRRSAPANWLSSPLAVGRQAVRFMRASICCSIRQLKAAAAAATSQMPALAASMVNHSPPRGTTGHGQGHADHRAENDQLHDPRLGQRIELAPAWQGKQRNCVVMRRPPAHGSAAAGAR